MNINLATKKTYGFRKKIAQNLLNEVAGATKKYWKWCAKAHAYDVADCLDKDMERLNTADGQERILKEMAEIKKALKRGKLVLKFEGGLHWSTGYIANDTINHIGCINKKALCGYPFSFEHDYYIMSVYGTSRPLEIILAYGHNLGLKFHDIPQRQQGDC